MAAHRWLVPDLDGDYRTFCAPATRYCWFRPGGRGRRGDAGGGSIPSTKEVDVRKLVGAGFSILAFAVVAAPPAGANPGPSLTGGQSSMLSMTAKITSFRATASGVVAQGTLTGKLRS